MTWNRQQIFELLLECGASAREAKRDLRREFKSDDSIVTQADRGIEALITERLADECRGVHIIGEETIAQKGERAVERALREEAFVVDPIDGTSPFSHGLPNWGVSIGFLREGHLIEGAVYLPEFGELVLSSERGVEEGRVTDDGEWTWRILEMPPVAPRNSGLIAVTQRVAKRGRVDLPNPVMALGAAVVPLVGLLQGRFLAYLGSVRLWDSGGAMPLLQKLGYSTLVRIGRELRPLGTAVDNDTLWLEGDAAKRWYYRGNLLVCRPGDEQRLSDALVNEET